MYRTRKLILSFILFSLILSGCDNNSNNDCVHSDFIGKLYSNEVNEMNHRFIDYSEGSDIFGNEAIILRTNRDSIPFWNMLVVKGNDEHDYSGDVNALNFYISLFKNHYCSFVPDENLGAASYHILDGNINFNGFNNASFKLTLIGRPAEYELPIDSFTNEVVHLNGCWNFPVSLNECQDCEL